MNETAGICLVNNTALLLWNKGQQKKANELGKLENLSEQVTITVIPQQQQPF